MDDRRERLMHAAEIAAGFEHDDGAARAAVRRVIAEHPGLEDQPATTIGLAARGILDGVPVTFTPPATCLACTEPGAGDPPLCAHHGPAYWTGVDRAVSDRAAVAG